MSPPKVEKTSSEHSYHHENFTPIGARYLCPGKNTYFPYRELPWGRGATVPCYIFGKLSSSLLVGTQSKCMF